MLSSAKSENNIVIDYNPSKRESLDFAHKLPSILDTGIAKLNWILSVQIFIHGVDLSHWNWSEGRMPDFKLIKANGFSFVILKVTESDWFIDERFEAGWMAALDAGLIVMPYHFNRTNKGGAVQAHWMVDHLSDYLKAIDGRTILWNDIETNDGGTITSHQNRAKAFNQTIVEIGFETGNYSSYELWKQIMGTTKLSWVNDYHQWVAHWTPNASPLMPIGWTRKEFWQYGIWPTYPWSKFVGTDGKVDVNRFYGTLENLKTLLGITDIPNDCCEDIKKELSNIYLRLAAIDDHIVTLNADDVTLAEQINLLGSSVEILRSKQTGLEDAQKNTQEHLGEMQSLLQRVRKAIL